MSGVSKPHKKCLPFFHRYHRIGEPYSVPSWDQHANPRPGLAVKVRCSKCGFEKKRFLK